MLLSFLGYIASAFFFVLERVIMPDTSFQLFSILKNGNFAIQVQRFGAVMTQSFPLLGYKLGFPLQGIVMLYSLSFPIVYAIIFILIVWVFKDLRLGLAYFLFHFLINTHSFFWMQCELIQGASFSILYFAFFNYFLTKNHKTTFWIANVFTIVTIVYFYPLLIVLLVFCFIYFGLNNKSNWKCFLYSFSIYLILFLLKNIFFKNYYDPSAISNLRYFKTEFPYYFSLPSFHNFLYYLKDYYGWFFAGFLAVGILIKKRKWQKLFLLIGFVLGLVILINVCYKNGAEQFYLEGQYSLINIFFAFPIAYELWDETSTKWKSFLISLTFLFFVMRIFEAAPIYQARIALYRDLINLSNEKKVILENTEERKKILKMNWGSAYEVWLLSTLEKGKTHSIVIADNIEQFDWGRNNTHVFLTQWESIDYKDLHPPYFLLNDKGSYVKN